MSDCDDSLFPATSFFTGDGDLATTVSAFVDAGGGDFPRTHSTFDDAVDGDAVDETNGRCGNEPPPLEDADVDELLELPKF